MHRITVRVITTVRGTESIKVRIVITDSKRNAVIDPKQCVVPPAAASRRLNLRHAAAFEVKHIHNHHQHL